MEESLEKYKNAMFQRFFKQAVGHDAERLLRENKRMHDLLKELLDANLPACSPDFQERVRGLLDGTMGVYGVGAKEQDRIKDEDIQFGLALRLLAKSVYLFRKYGMEKIAINITKEAEDAGLELLIFDEEAIRRNTLEK
jgi:hypothetical protein